jgi:hypothetical protein
MEVKGVNVKFKHQKIIFILKFKMYIHWFNAFAFQRSFLELQIHTHSFLSLSKQIRNEKDLWFERKGNNVFFPT